MPDMCSLGNRFHLPRESILAVSNKTETKSINSSISLENKKIAQSLRQWMILAKHTYVALKFNFTSWRRGALRCDLAKIKPACRFVYQLPTAGTFMTPYSVAQKDSLQVINK